MHLLKRLLLSTAVCFSFIHSNNAQTDPLPTHWHHKNIIDGFYGVNNENAYSFLKSKSKNLSSITVAVIDGDLDINHEDLKSNLWVNTSNKSSYPKGTHGWNFLGTSDNKLISKVGTEAFREYKRLRPKYEGTESKDWNKKKDIEEYIYFTKVKKDAKIQGYLNFFPLIKLTYEAYRITDSVLQVQRVDGSTFKIKQLADVKSNDTLVQQNIDAVIRTAFRYSDTLKWNDLYTHQITEYETAIKRIKSLDDLSNPRDHIGDNLKSLKDKYYGNAVLVDSNSYHGTFVAGLIGAERDNAIGIDGIAANAQLMGLRAVPDGDEFDKDIALSIRYAVDHGAKIINMSFGKYYSPNSKWVTDAIAYALKNDVLVIQAAGNDNRNLDTINCYPIKPSKIKERHNSYLRISASTYEGQKAKFSNYGSKTVDFFAPGEKITSTATFNTYKTANGTSFSAPIVSGVAALVWGAYPELKAYEVAEILKRSAQENSVKALEGYAVIPGIVDAYKSLIIAEEYVKK